MDSQLGAKGVVHCNHKHFLDVKVVIATCKSKVLKFNNSILDKYSTQVTFGGFYTRWGGPGYGFYNSCQLSSRVTSEEFSNSITRFYDEIIQSENRCNKSFCKPSGWWHFIQQNYFQKFKPWLGHLVDYI